MFTRTLVACYATTAAIHLASIMLNTLLPFHVVALGGSRIQVGLMFSVTTVVSMFLRPMVGGWVDRAGVRRVIVPGIAALAGTSLALHGAASPVAVIALMAGIGVSNGLVSTAASVMAARGSAAEHRGETLSVYYLASSLAVAAAPPLAFGLRHVGGMPLAFVTVTLLAGLMTLLARSFPAAATPPVAGAPPGVRLWSRHAAPASGALILATMGHSSIYAFLPLYAVGQGQGRAVAWFFAVYPLWLIGCRALLRGVSDRVGRARVVAPAMGFVAAAFFVLALRPTPVSLVAAAVLMGTGNSMLYPTLAALVVDRAPEPERGLALGTLSGAWDLGVVLGSALVGFVADRVSYSAGFAVAGATGVVGLSTFIRTERRRDRLAVSSAPDPTV